MKSLAWLVAPASFGALFLSTLGVAAAQPASSAPPPAEPVSMLQPAPDFITLDRVGYTSKLGLDVGAIQSVEGEGDFTGFQFDIHGRWLSPAGYGFYFSVPLNLVSIDGADDESALGAPEIGGLYLLPQDGFDLALRGGLTLPVADEQDFFVNLLGGLNRLVDLAQAFPKTAVLRGSASLIGTSGQLFYQLDVGMDVPVLDTSDTFDVENDPFLHLNAGLGLKTGSIALVGETVNMVFTGGDDGLGDEDALHAIGGALRSHGGPLEWHVGLYTYLDPILEDEDGVILLLAGLAARI